MMSSRCDETNHTQILPSYHRKERERKIERGRKTDKRGEIEESDAREIKIEIEIDR